MPLSTTTSNKPQKIILTPSGSFGGLSGARPDSTKVNEIAATYRNGTRALWIAIIIGSISSVSRNRNDEDDGTNADNNIVVVNGG